MTDNASSWLRNTGVCIALVALTVAVFGQTLHFPFTNYDDPAYVTQNPHVESGLTLANVAWAFRTGHAANWHPVTWLSHMLDCQLFGLNPAGPHAVNVLLHTLNAVLLYLLLTRMTGAAWRSAFVAALFAVHPLHVESVAWIAERKDVLSAFLGLLALWAYLRFVARPGWGRYTAVVGLYALGLMAKPMLVTLPLVFLLLDYWPLRRFDSDRHWGKILAEKAPLLCLAAASSVVTFIVQREGGAVMRLGIMPMPNRINNALVSYVRYLAKTVAPVNLCVYYPRQVPPWSWWQAAAAGGLLALITLVTLIYIRQRPYLSVGWFWFLGMLFPVIGIVQVGNQAMADRYTYLPLIGVFIMVAWGVPDALRAWRAPKGTLVVAGTAVVVVMAVFAMKQVSVWRNNITLYQRALAVTRNNALAHNNLGEALARLGRMREAFNQFGQAIKADPNYEKAHYNKGVAFLLAGDDADAIRQLRTAIALNPRHYDAVYNLAAAFAQAGKLNDAVAEFEKAIKLDPEQADAHVGLAKVLHLQGKTRQAITELNTGARLHMRDPEAYYLLGAALNAAGERARAISALSEARRLKPDYTEAAALLKKIQTGAATLPGPRPNLGARSPGPER